MRIIFYVTEIIDPEFVDEVPILFNFLERSSVARRVMHRHRKTFPECRGQNREGHSSIWKHPYLRNSD